MANHHFDSRRWDGFDYRGDDIIIASWAKSGTTWLQQIVLQLVFGGWPEISVAQLSPWVDMRLAPLDEISAELARQPNRRVLKTHLPADALDIRADVKYFYIAREPIDVAWSWHQHHLKFTDDAYRQFNETPGREGPPLPRPQADFRAYFHEWLDGDGHPFHPYWSNVASWWALRHSDNVRLLHFDDLRRDLLGQARAIAAFLEIELDEAAMARVVEYASLPHMKAKAALVAPLGGQIFKGGAQTFVRSGAPRQWAGRLSAQDIEKCRAIACRDLPAECLDWLLREPPTTTLAPARARTLQPA